MAYPSHQLKQKQPAPDAMHQFYTFWGDNPIAAINACFILVTFGQVLLTILFGTLVLAPTVRRRNATLHNMLIVTLLVSIPPCLLYYTGHILDEHPPETLCAAQAVLINGTETMFIIAASALVLEVLTETGLVILPIRECLRTWSLVALPYVVFIVFTLWGGILAAGDKDCVRHEKNEVYCSITYGGFAHGIETVSATVVILTLMAELYAFVFYRRLWREIWSRGSSRRYPKPPTFNLYAALRIVGFTCMQLFYFVLLVVGFYQGSVAMYVVPTAYTSLMPLATFFIFGLSYDTLLTWRSWILFWRPPPVPPKPAALSVPRKPAPVFGPPPAYYYSPYNTNPSSQNRGVDKPLPRPPPPIYALYATSESPAVNDAKARGEEFPVMDIC